jgi:hypothetical protein
MDVSRQLLFRPNTPNPTRTNPSNINIPGVKPSHSGPVASALNSKIVAHATIVPPVGMPNDYFTFMIVLSSRNRSPAKCPPWSLHGLSSLKDMNQCHHDRDEQENVNESSQCVRGGQTQRPEDKQNNGEGTKHFRPLLPGFSDKPSKRNGLFETSSPIREDCSTGLTHVDDDSEGVRRIPREESPCQPQQIVVVVRPF